ncbi:MAG: helix-turn-helix domain-containing protein [Chloroflexota bacterium]|nr:helix-turn-helix domain-containing protein [Chloroflexota bacterium]
MAKRDPQRTMKLRIAVRYLIDRGCLAQGNQSRLAEHFQVSRQRVHQIVVEERKRPQEHPTVASVS